MNGWKFATVVFLTITVVFCAWYGINHNYFTPGEVRQDFNHALNNAIGHIPKPEH